MTERFHVIIVGAGPAGIFAAMELCQEPGLKVLMVERGEDLDQRVTKKPTGRSLLSGWGGAGAFSDGKLTLTTEFGGQLSTILPDKDLMELIRQVDQVYLDFGAPQETYGADQETIQQLSKRAARADLKLITARIRHLGTERCEQVVRRMREELDQKITLKTSTDVVRLLIDSEGTSEQRRVVGVETAKGDVYRSDFVIVAPGRAGAEWLSQETQRLQLQQFNNPVDVGVRVELPATVLEPLTDVVYESKLIFHSKSFDDRVRTFCMCPYGEVVTEENNGIVTVNGHSYAHKKTLNTNFALLVSINFTEPFKEPIAYGQYLARLANIIGGGVLVQRLGDLRTGRRSTAERMARGLVSPTLTTATPGDLSFVLPYRYLTDLLEMIDALDRLAPGVNSRHTLLYGVEVKFYSSRPKLTLHLETEITNLFAIGDGAGVTRGLIQASASGVLAAREIKRRITG